MSTFNYNHLRYFWVVAHTGTLTGAARQLRVSQSAISVQIKKLEDELGHLLFERKGRRLQLSEVGRIALDHADAIFATGDDMMATLEARATAQIPLRAGALATLSRNFQLGFIESILARPDPRLSVVSGTLDELLRSLSEHRLDVVLSNRPAPRRADSSLISHRIAEQPVSLIGPPRYRGTRRRLETLLANEPMLLPTPGSSIRAGFDALADRLGITPTVAVEVDDMAMFRLIARSGAGLAVVPPIVVKDELHDGTLVEVRQIPELAEIFYAITLPRRFPHPLVQQLIAGSD
jgi:LysR family transcriptional activator of nhaA